MMKYLFFVAGLLAIVASGVLSDLSYSGTSTAFGFIGVICMAIAALITVFNENIV
jgi:NAD/NADP transhydrogenase beta subunit